MRLQDLDGQSKAEPNGITSFVYQRRRPFHPDRFVQWAKRYWVFADADNANADEGNVTRADEEALDAARGMVFGNPRVLRSRGVVWLASRPRLSFDWKQAGIVAEFRSQKPWFAELPDFLWLQAEERKGAQKNCQEPFGDRRQEFVFLGQGMKQDAICETLDACLLNEDEWDCYLNAVGDAAKLLKHFRDPLLSWECPSSEDVPMDAIPTLLLPPLRDSCLAAGSPLTARNGSEYWDGCEGRLASREQTQQAEQKSGEHFPGKKPRLHE